jgi:arylsulfatase A-like enzyme
VCSPSRAGLLTGRQQNRFGFEFNVGSGTLSVAEGRGLPEGELTVGDVLGDAGLATTYLGKWHVGPLPSQDPRVRGFDHFFGLLGGQRWPLRPGELDVIDVWPEVLEEPEPAWPYGHEVEAVTDDGVIVDLDPRRHLTDSLADRAVDHLAALDDRPFFLLVAFTAAHEPFQAGPEHTGLLTDPSPDPARRAYEGTLAGLDAAVGRVLAALDASGRADDTLVVFTSDHGCDELLGLCSNAPLSGGKLRLTEGGLRVPLLLRWPDRVAPGSTFDDPVSTLDLLPTSARAVGAPLPADRALDGVDLLPFLRGELVAPHPVLGWRLGTAVAVRVGDDKAVVTDGRTWLFDLAADPGETTDLSASSPDRVEALTSAYKALAGVFVAPLWSGRDVTVPVYGEDHGITF